MKKSPFQFQSRIFWEITFFQFFENFFSGIRRRENQREGFRRAMAEKEKNKKEFEEWHETTRAAEAEKTSKVIIR